MNRTECLEEAKRIVNGARQENYGNPESNFKEIAWLWNEYLDIGLEAEDVAIMMILMKIARLKNKKNHVDSWVDICGYAANGCEITTSCDENTND